MNATRWAGVVFCLAGIISVIAYSIRAARHMPPNNSALILGFAMLVFGVYFVTRRVAG